MLCASLQFLAVTVGAGEGLYPRKIVTCWLTPLSLCLLKMQ